LPGFSQKENYRQSPNPEDQSGYRPEILTAPIMAGNHATENRIEKMDQRRRVQQRCRIDLWSQKNESGEIT
jgi:hypothetical protein